MSGTLGQAVARVLRAGTLLSVAAVAVGYLAAWLSGGAGPGPTPLVEMLAAWPGDALIGVGLLLLTLTPAAALVAAVPSLWGGGERSRAITAGVVALLLIGSLVASALLGGTA